MAALSAVDRRVSALADVFVANCAHLVYSRRRITGVLIIAALANQPRCLALGIVSLIAGEITARRFGLRDPNGPWAMNALLCGVALGSAYPLGPAALALAVVLGASAVFITGGLSAIATTVGQVPVGSLPFVLCLWFGLAVAPHVGLTGAAWVADPLAHFLPPIPALVLQSLGMMVLVPHVAAGALVLAALLFHSRIASVFALGVTAASVVILRLGVAGGALPPTVIQLAGCNAALVAMAIGGIWLVPSRRSFVLALGTGFLAAFFTVGLWAPFWRLGLSVSFLPLNAALILTLVALRQRAADAEPVLAPVATSNPEELAANYDARPRHVFEAGDALSLSLPFSGAWICTQGVDGPYTHRGILRHAYDFEVTGPDGALCKGAGHQPQDYHCYAKPILAVADGTVAAVESTVPNNGVGEDSPQKPWGNYVVLYHAQGLYSTVAHLLQASVVVYPGQFVKRGTILGYCGNSGRAPRPHLHFQLQSTADPGSQTLPSRFSEAMIQSGKQTRFEVSYRPGPGEIVEPVVPDRAVGTLFDIPLGTSLKYHFNGRQEEIVCDLDAWGRSVLRSVTRGTELVIVRGESQFSCGELRGNVDSVLTLLRIALPRVPLERRSALTFRSDVSPFWTGGGLRRFGWGIAVPLVGVRNIELESRFEITPAGVAVRGSSFRRASDGGPILQTYVLFEGRIGPRVIQVTTSQGVQKAEMLIDQPRITRVDVPPVPFTDWRRGAAEHLPLTRGAAT